MQIVVTCEVPIQLKLFVLVFFQGCVGCEVVGKQYLYWCGGPCFQAIAFLGSSLLHHSPLLCPCHFTTKLLYLVVHMMIFTFYWS